MSRREDRYERKRSRDDHDTRDREGEEGAKMETPNVIICILHRTSPSEEGTIQ